MTRITTSSNRLLTEINLIIIILSRIGIISWMETLISNTRITSIFQVLAMTTALWMEGPWSNWSFSPLLLTSTKMTRTPRSILAPTSMTSFQTIWSRVRALSSQLFRRESRVLWRELPCLPSHNPPMVLLLPLLNSLKSQPSNCPSAVLRCSLNPFTMTAECQAADRVIRDWTRRSLPVLRIT